MQNLDIQEQINLLESRQIELKAVIASSDKYASKCVKLNENFAELYPEHYAAYNASVAEYNENEAELEELYAKRKEEEEEQPRPEE